MIKHLLLLSTALGLAACGTTDKYEAVPTPIVADFDQEFTLNYRQQALLSAAIQPELTVEVTDIQYKLCPKDILCFTPNFVTPTLRVTDAQGNTQQLKMSVNLERAYMPNWLDTTSVRANGRRYAFHYIKWEVDQMRDQPGKKDITVTFRVVK